MKYTMFASGGSEFSNTTEDKKILNYKARNNWNGGKATSMVGKMMAKRTKKTTNNWHEE